MVKSIEEPAGISYIAVQPKLYREEKKNGNQEWENRILEAETKFLRIAFAIMAVLLIASEATTAVVIRFA